MFCTVRQREVQFTFSVALSVVDKDHRNGCPDEVSQPNAILYLDVNPAKQTSTLSDTRSVGSFESFTKSLYCRPIGTKVFLVTRDLHRGMEEASPQVLSNFSGHSLIIEHYAKLFGDIKTSDVTIEVENSKPRSSCSHFRAIASA